MYCELCTDGGIEDEFHLSYTHVSVITMTIGEQNTVKQCA